ncbi:ribonuclease H-like domain-containing protein [Tanacetum coccineum]
MLLAKKTQKTLLKQQYENFSATSAESLDSIFNRLQKIVSRLAILGVIIAQEDLNLKFLSSLPSEWNTHVVVWMNKPEIETMSIDDLYNNFKIVEQKIKKTVGTSSGGQNLAFMTAPSSSSINDANTAYSQVSAASPSVNTASPQVCTTSVSDNTVYAFMVENPNGSNVLHQDLEQIHEDDLEVIDLKWQLSLLTVRAKKYYQKIGKKIFINSNDITGYDKSKVKCYNCYKLGHFARECRATKNKEDQFRNQDNTRKKGNKQDTSKAMLDIDGVGFDWSEMAEEQVQSNMALMAFSDSENPRSRAPWLLLYSTNRPIFTCILVPPPHPLIYNRPNKLDLSYSGLDEFKEPEFKGYGPENSKKESNIVKESDNSKENSDKSLVKELESQVKSSFVKGCGCNTSKKVSEVEPKKVRENNDAPIIEDWVLDDEEQDESITKTEKKTITPTAAKIEKPVRKSVRYAEMYRSQRPRGNQRNWNGQKSNQLGSEFVMYNKACFNCGSFNHVQRNCTYHQKKKVVSGNNYNRVDNYYYAKTSHYRTHKNVTPRAVLLRTGLKPLSTAKPVYTAHPKPTVNTVRPRIVNTARSYRTPVNTVRPRVINTARQNRTSVNAARANGFNVGKPQHDDKGFVDSRCSRHMTGNIAYLSDFKQFDGGYVAFGGGAYGGKISGISKEVGTPRYLSLVVPLTKVGDEAIHKELGDRMERAATTASSLEAEQDSDTILGDVNAQTRFEITSKQSIDPPLSRGYTLRSGEDSMKLIGIDKIFPKFAETHNVVAFLEKPKESDGFAEIIDFLKASSVSYALTVNPVIYTSCIEQFWATAKRTERDFSGRITPLFDTMMVQPIEEMGEDSDHLTDSTLIHIIDQPSSSSQPKKDKPSKKAQRQEAEVPQDEAEHEESVPTPSNDPQPSGEDAQAKEIAALKKRIHRLERRKMSRPTSLKRLRKVGMSRRVESSEDQESLGAPEDASKQGRSIEDIDADVDVSLVDETQERQNDDLMFDSGSKKPDDSTASIDDSAVPTTNEEITLAQTLIQIKAAKPKVVTTAATTATTTTPKDRGVVVQEPSTESKKKREEVERKHPLKGSRKKMLGRKRVGKEQQKESSKKQKVEEEKESEEVDEVDEIEL